MTTPSERKPKPKFDRAFSTSAVLVAALGATVGVVAQVLQTHQQLESQAPTPTTAQATVAQTAPSQTAPSQANPPITAAPQTDISPPVTPRFVAPQITAPQTNTTPSQPAQPQFRRQFRQRPLGTTRGS